MESPAASQATRRPPEPPRPNPDRARPSAPAASPTSGERMIRSRARRVTLLAAAVRRRRKTNPAIQAMSMTTNLVVTPPGIWSSGALTSSVTMVMNTPREPIETTISSRRRPISVARATSQARPIPGSTPMTRANFARIASTASQNWALRKAKTSSTTKTAAMMAASSAKIAPPTLSHDAFLAAPFSRHSSSNASTGPRSRISCHSSSTVASNQASSPARSAPLRSLNQLPRNPPMPGMSRSRSSAQSPTGSSGFIRASSSASNTLCRSCIFAKSSPHAPSKVWP